MKLNRRSLLRSSLAAAALTSTQGCLSGAESRKTDQLSGNRFALDMGCGYSYPGVRGNPV